MGMSASQMRYCLLTGKKSDIEFQGQQINQQRTTLATETSTYNNQLLGLVVPTPPSNSAYTKSTYSFTSATGELCTITGAQYNSSNAKNADGTDPQRWTVNYTTTSVGDQGKIYAMPSVINTNGNFTIGGNTLQPVNLTSLLNGGVATNEDTTDYSNLLKICQDCGILRDGNNNPITNPTPGQIAGVGNPNGNVNFYKYASDGITKYVLASSLTGITPGNSAPEYTYYVDTKATLDIPQKLVNAKVHFAESGRMSYIEAYDDEGNVITYDLSVKNNNDDAAYKDALEEYNYQKGLYDQEIEKINAQICTIESQDKCLELKLKDLDTQQEAINTEIDAVKKVIDKNIEQSFKAMG